jgi:transcriptional regulator with XRE-family HTH domain
MAESDQGSDDASDQPSKGAGDSSSDKLTLAPELIQARERLGLTQAQLAAESGLSLASIKGYETGRTLPGARELRRLCTALRITPNKLIFGDEAPFSAGRESEVFAGPYGITVHRNRIRLLADHLTSDEAASFASLMSALVLARHGKETALDTEEVADLMSGFQVIAGGGPFVSDLFRLITRDPTVARQVAEALKKAAGVASGEIRPDEAGEPVEIHVGRSRKGTPAALQGQGSQGHGGGKAAAEKAASAGEAPARDTPPDPKAPGKVSKK